MGIISIGVLVLGGAGTATGAYIITLIGFLVFGVAGVGCFTSMRESHILSITVNINYNTQRIYPLLLSLRTFDCSFWAWQVYLYFARQFS